MIDFKYADLFADDSISKQIIISYDRTVITNEDLFNQEFTLEESLCSENELRFGACEASVVRFKVANIVAPMIGKWITVSMVLEGHTDEPFPIGRYRVEEDKVASDRKWRDITAYDALYGIIKADVSKWYNTVFPSNDTKITMEMFRNSFMFLFDLDQAVPADGLVNDNMLIEKTINPEELSGGTVIQAICEINGCFGHIDREGRFRYVTLERNIQGLYPRKDLYPSEHLYPREPKTAPIGADKSYIECRCGDYLVQTIDKLQIRQEENDIGVVIGGSGTNAYVIEDNFLVYGKGSDELGQIASNIFGVITKIVYRPFEAEVKGNLCFEVGDPVRVSTRECLVQSYILQRKLKGTQALRDRFTAEGLQYRSLDVNSTHKAIIQLKGKTNAITRTVEENRLEMLDIERSLSFTIATTAAGLKADITAEQERAEGEEVRLSTSITALAGQVVLKVQNNGDIALVRLEADPDEGTVFQVKAKNISLTADEAMRLMSGGTLDITALDIDIRSTNWTVDKAGNAAFNNIRCNNIRAFSIASEAKNDFNTEVSDSQAMRLAQEATSKAQGAADAANRAISDINAHIKNINGSIDKINRWILQLSDQVKALGQPGIS